MRLVYYATAQMARLKRLAQPAMPTAAKGKRWGPEPELRTREVATPLHPAPSTAQTPPANTHTEGTPQQQTQDGFLAKVTGKRPAPEVTRALLQAKVDDLLAKLQADASLTNPAGTAELLHTLGAERLPRSPSPPHSDSSGSPYYDWLPGDETWGIPDDT
jgi:hypothetical protein